MRRALLVSTLLFTGGLAFATADPVALAAGDARQLTRPADGFTLAVPAGWRENADLGGAAGLSAADGSEAYLSVSVRREPARAPTSEVLTRFVTKMRTSTDPAVVSSRFGTFLGRRAVLAELQDADARYRIILVPRDTGETSQDFFLITAWSAKALFAKLQPAFNTAIAGFEITAVTPPANARSAQAPAASAKTSPRGVTSDDARRAWFDAQLRPGPGPAVAPAAPGDKDQQKRVDAADAYAKGLTFATQGAWPEAQAAFRDAEKKNNKIDAYVFATAWAYLKVHKPADAMKRYQDAYKKNPANATALVGMIASHEESQNYRESVKLWRRYATLPIATANRAEVQSLLAGAQELFAARYEIAENPAGGAPNLATPADELEWGRSYAKELAASGVPLVTDPEVISYVEALCQTLVDHSKAFPSNYQLFVLDSATVNATTIPGYIFVYRGILDASDSEAALAGVLAHEIGHSVAHHAAKKVTKNYQDQKQLESLQKSSSKLSQFLAKMLAGGNPIGALEFSREAEAQADRLAVHIAFDAGFKPDAIADLFQKFEQMSPSSRSQWDLMTRTHPFSIDRINAVREYAALLPDRPTTTTSPAFERLKVRLSALPPPPDATGMMKADTPPARTGAAASLRTVPFNMAPAPFSGEMPEGWTLTRRNAQFAVFSAPAGTPYAETSMWLEVPTKAAHAGRGIDDMVEVIRVANAKLPQIQFGDVDRRKSGTGLDMRVLPGLYMGKTTTGIATPIQCMWVFVDFEDYFAISYYGAPKDFFTKLSAGFDILMDSLTYGAVAPAAPPASTPPAPAAGRQSFSVDAPPYTGEMPTGWVARRDGGVVIIEGAKGTEAYEMTIRLVFYERAGRTIDAMATELRDALQKLPGANVAVAPDRKTQEGRTLRAVMATYTGKNSTGASVPFQQVVAIVEYPEHFVLLGYAGPAALFDKYMTAYQMIGTTLAPRR